MRNTLLGLVIATGMLTYFVGGCATRYSANTACPPPAPPEARCLNPVTTAAERNYRRTLADPHWVSDRTAERRRLRTLLRRELRRESRYLERVLDWRDGALLRD